MEHVKYRWPTEQFKIIFTAVYSAEGVYDHFEAVQKFDYLFKAERPRFQATIGKGKTKRAALLNLIEQLKDDLS